VHHWDACGQVQLKVHVETVRPREVLFTDAEEGAILSLGKMGNSGNCCPQRSMGFNVIAEPRFEWQGPLA
jgi:hypothetical protein